MFKKQQQTFCKAITNARACIVFVVNCNKDKRQKDQQILLLHRNHTQLTWFKYRERPTNKKKQVTKEEKEKQISKVGIL